MHHGFSFIKDTEFKRKNFQCVKNTKHYATHLHAVAKIYPGSCTIYFCYQTYRIQRKYPKIGKTPNMLNISISHQTSSQMSLEFFELFSRTIAFCRKCFSIGGKGIANASLIFSDYSYTSITQFLNSKTI